ncbi:caspase family protein [Streptomyces sp. L7]
MARHRALLIGASDYEMRGVPRLPFVPGDLARLGSVLKDRGFDVQVVAEREDGKQVSRNFVDGQVTGFLRRAGKDDTLLILLSGHGVHAGGATSSSRRTSMRTRTPSNPGAWRSTGTHTSTRLLQDASYF